MGELEKMYAQAVAEYSQSRYMSASKIFLGLIQMDSSQARFFNGIAACMQMLGRHEQASLAYATAYQLKPDDPMPLLYLAQCFFSVGGKQEANEAAQTFLNATAEKVLVHRQSRVQAVAIVKSTTGLSV